MKFLLQKLINFEQTDALSNSWAVNDQSHQLALGFQQTDASERFVVQKDSEMMVGRES